MGDSLIGLLSRIQKLEERQTKMESLQLTHDLKDYRDFRMIVIDELDKQRRRMDDMQTHLLNLQRRLFADLNHDDKGEASLLMRIKSLETFTVGNYRPTWEHDDKLHPTIDDLHNRLLTLEYTVYASDRESQDKESQDNNTA